jgi:hypothetical protein
MLGFDFCIVALCSAADSCVLPAAPARPICNMLQLNEHYIDGLLETLNDSIKLALLCSSRFFLGMLCDNYGVISARSNISTLFCRRWHVCVLFLINVFKSKFSLSSIFDNVSVRIVNRIIRGKSTLQ